MRGLLFASLFVSLSVHAQAPSAGFVYEWDYPRCASSTADMARLVHDCMSKVMFPRGLAGGQQPEVDVHDAALVCRTTRSFEMNRSLSSCVRSLMYERSGLGARREAVTGQAAAAACQYATSIPQGEQVEDCMKRLLFTRGGLGYERTDMTPSAAAYACQGVAAPPPPLPLWSYQPVCRPPVGEEAVRFLDECVKGLMYERHGLGERRAHVTPEAAALACQGALSWWP